MLRALPVYPCLQLGNDAPSHAGHNQLPAGSNQPPRGAEEPPSGAVDTSGADDIRGAVDISTATTRLLDEGQGYSACPPELLQQLPGERGRREPLHSSVWFPTSYL